MKKLIFIFTLLIPNLFISQYLSLNSFTTWSDYEIGEEDRPIEVVIVPVDGSENIQEPVRLTSDQFYEKIKLNPGLYDIKVYYINSGDDDVLIETIHSFDVLDEQINEIELNLHESWTYDSSDTLAYSDVFIENNFGFGNYIPSSGNEIINSHFVYELNVKSLYVVNSFYSLGFNVGMGYSNSVFDENQTISLTGLHEKESYNYLFSNVAFVNRFTFYDNTNYDNNGFFMDLGINYSLPILFRHNTRDGNFKTVENKIHKFNDVQGICRIGYKGISLYANYRIFDIVKNNYPSLPKFVFGITFDLEY
ncbi:MAG: hypothetical protein CL846_04025 [Crocinitomicaceae bacterium]|nr:hypothetical protein [Crocinitomicaceae bacterium]|tara:strand:+ start:3469 stop:4389 length:921 start_codon:yes stop_codon:yes gene_type:complete